MAAVERPRRLKLVLCGDGGVGKTTYIKRFATNVFEREYIATVGVEVSTIRFCTNRGRVDIVCWDTAGQERFGRLRDEYYRGADAALIMFDVTARATYQNVPQWYHDIERVCGSIPVVICGNKVESRDRQVKAHEIVYPARKGIPYCDVSALTTYGTEVPFLRIVRAVLGADTNLVAESDMPSAPAPSPAPPPQASASSRAVASSCRADAQSSKSGGTDDPMDV
jgi:GTP-binding nuclear protein Ran